jgi:hypothetical protein
MCQKPFCADLGGRVLCSHLIEHKHCCWGVNVVDPRGNDDVSICVDVVVFFFFQDIF